ncbi:hypothetical protein LTR86_008257 [Recurvomyces mirabilis]|nr:hypothetical protein LTR86_008257 [Recurvomyces mirabilis]
MVVPRRRHGLVLFATAFINADIVTGKRWARDAIESAGTSNSGWQNTTQTSSTTSALPPSASTISASITPSSTSDSSSTTVDDLTQQSLLTTSATHSTTTTQHATTSGTATTNDTALPTAPWFSIATSEYNITSIMMTKALPSSEWSSYQYSGDCWDQWSQYWSPSVFAVALTTSTGTKTNSFETQNGTTFTSSVNGVTYTKTYQGTTESYYLNPGPFTQLATVQTANTPITTPGCALPTSVSQCQSQWSSWLNASIALRGDDDSVSKPMPSCTQASVGSELCTSLAMVVLEDDPAQTAINWGHKTISPWPSNSQLAPGCTLGCQQCSITGNTIRLFYWPPATSNVSGISAASQTYGNRSAQSTAVVNGEAPPD